MNQYNEDEHDNSSKEELYDVYRYLRESTSYPSACFRVTSCDIMCTTNTAKQYDLRPLRGAKKKAHLPYRQPDVLPAFSSGATDMQLLVNSGAKYKRCVELKRERDEFMQSLHGGRDDTARLDNYAATRIQARFRGYRRRRGGIDLEKILKNRQDNPRLTSSKEIREELTEWAGKIGLKPVPGLSLESIIKKSLHQKKLEAHAATRLKGFLRVAVACSRVRRRRAELLEVRKFDAATTIQRFFKYIVFQTKLEGIVALLKRKGAVQIQTYCRGWLARFRVKKLRKTRRDEAKRIEAKIKLQRMFRKKYSSNSLVLVETVLPHDDPAAEPSAAVSPAKPRTPSDTARRRSSLPQVTEVTTEGTL